MDTVTSPSSVGAPSALASATALTGQPARMMCDSLPIDPYAGDASAPSATSFAPCESKALRALDHPRRTEPRNAAANMLRTSPPAAAPTVAVGTACGATSVSACPDMIRSPADATMLAEASSERRRMGSPSRKRPTARSRPCIGTGNKTSAAPVQAGSPPAGGPPALSTAAESADSMQPPPATLPTPFVAKYARSAAAASSSACAFTPVVAPVARSTSAAPRPQSAAGRAAASQHAITTALGTKSRKSSLIVPERCVPWAGIGYGVAHPGDRSGEDADAQSDGDSSSGCLSDQALGVANDADWSSYIEATVVAPPRTSLRNQCAGSCLEECAFVIPAAAASEDRMENNADAEDLPSEGPEVDSSCGMRGAPTLTKSDAVGGRLNGVVDNMRALMAHLKAEHDRMSAELRAAQGAAEALKARVEELSAERATMPTQTVAQSLTLDAAADSSAVVEARREAATIKRHAEEATKRAADERRRLETALTASKAAARAAEVEVEALRSELHMSSREVEALRTAIRSSAVAARAAVADMSPSQLRDEVRRLRFEKELCRVREALGAREAASRELAKLERTLKDETHWILERLATIAAAGAGTPANGGGTVALACRPSRPSTTSISSTEPSFNERKSGAGEGAAAREAKLFCSRLAKNVQHARRAIRSGLLQRPPEVSLPVMMEAPGQPKRPISAGLKPTTVAPASRHPAADDVDVDNEPPSEWRSVPAALTLAQAIWLARTCEVLMPECVVTVFDPRLQDDESRSPWCILSPAPLGVNATDAIVGAPLGPPPPANEPSMPPPTVQGGRFSLKVAASTHTNLPKAPIASRRAQSAGPTR